MTESDKLAAVIDGRGVVTATLNRPEVSNAIDADVMRALVRIVDSCGSDERARVLVLRAEGRHFSAGADLKADLDAGGDVPTVAAIIARFERFPLPLAAVVQGACIGLAAGIVGCCDVVVAEEKAFFSLPEVQLGITPLDLLPSFSGALGIARASRYALTGERFTARQGLEFGMVHAVADRDDLADQAHMLVDALVRAAPGAQKAVKAALAALRRGDFVLPAEHGMTDEGREGIAAFAEKRAPSWCSTTGAALPFPANP